jgi:hypothetical protein
MPVLMRHPGAWALVVLAFISALLAIILTFVHRDSARRLYHHHFSEKPRERLLMASIGFYVALAVVRTLTHLIRSGRGPFHDVSVGGRHIHHLVWGILLLLLIGFGWLIQIGTGLQRTSLICGRIFALLYGIGAALTLDEFALWLNLRDVYWEREGRASIDALMLFGSLLLIGVFGAVSFTLSHAKPFIQRDHENNDKAVAIYSDMSKRGKRYYFREYAGGVKTFAAISACCRAGHAITRQ